jgi:hypothetical protein
MKILALLFLLLSQSSLAVAPNQTELGGAWLEKDSQWINAPKEVAPLQQWSQTAAARTTAKMAIFSSRREQRQTHRLSGGGGGI